MTTDHKERFYDFLMTVFGVVIGGFILFVLGNGLAYLPQIEAWVSPVVRFGVVTVTHRDHEKMCFALPVEKLAAADPLKYDFSIESKLSGRINVSAYVADPDWTRRTKPGLENHPVGAKWTRNYCFETPATVADFQSVTVSGYGVHRRHPFYDTRTAIHPFDIPGLPD